MESIRYWWVNQGNTMNAEKENGYLFAPLFNKAGRAMYHWDTLMDLRPGDKILHYSKGKIRYISTVLEPFMEVNLPRTSQEGDWDQKGRLVKVRYEELNIDKNDFKDQLLELNPIPKMLTRTGTIVQGYLFPLTDEAFNIITKEEE